MSSEEAVQEVRRIFTNNSVEQACEYLDRITPGIQESDERLKQLVGQSYRGLIAACDQVVVVEQTCRKLLLLHKQLQKQHGRRQSPVRPGSRGNLSSFAASSPRGGEGAHKKECGHFDEPLLATTTWPSSGTELGAAALRDTPMAGVDEVEPGGNNRNERLVHTREAMSSSGEAERQRASQREELSLTHQCTALEGLLGTWRLRRAAALFLHIRDKWDKRVKGFNVDCYEIRIRQTICGLLRNDADQAAVQAITETVSNESSRTPLPINAAGTSDEAKEVRSGAFANTFIPISNTSSTSNVVRRKWNSSQALSHMMEVHATLELLSGTTPRTALLLLIDVVGNMVKTDMDFVTSSWKENPFTQPLLVDFNSSGGSGLPPLRRMEWLRAVVQLPPHLQCGADAHNLPDTAATCVEGDVTKCCVRSAVSDAEVALHIVQRAQHLFYHLVLYIASLFERQDIGGERRGACEDHIGTANRAAAQQAGNLAGGSEQPGAPSTSEMDAYMESQKRKFALQSLLTLRDKLNARELGTKEDAGSTNTTSLRMSGSLTRGALSASNLGGSVTLTGDGNESRKPEEAKEEVLGVSSSSMILDKDGKRRSRRQTPYIREVMWQVCGMQLLDSQAVQQNTVLANEAVKRNDVGKVEEGTDVDLDSNAKCAEFDFQEVRNRLLSVQESVLSLMLCVSNAGLLRDPRAVSVQERVARQQAQIFRSMLSRDSGKGRGPLSVDVSDLFDEHKWNKMVSEATESALLGIVSTVLKKADKVCSIILNCMCMEKGDAVDCINNPTRQPQNFETMTNAASVSRHTDVSLNLPLDARQVLKRSIFLSETMASESLHGDYMTSLVPHLFSASGGGVHRWASTASGKSESINTALARDIMQCAWNTPEIALNDPKGFSIQNGKINGCVFEESEINKGGSAGLMRASSRGFEREENLFAVEEDEFGTVREVVMGTTRNNEDAEGAGKRGSVTVGKVERGASVTLQLSLLSSMLQRIFNVEHMWAGSHVAVSTRIRNWFTETLHHIRDLVLRRNERYQERTLLGGEGEDFEEGAESMTVLNRISLLLEALLHVLENTASHSKDDLLVKGFRETIVTCHRPWVLLLRTEWESGLCYAYQSALTPSHMNDAAGGEHDSTAAGDSAPCLRGRCFTVEYATCWCHTALPGQQPQAHEALSYPVHVTPHIYELLFQLQHLLFKNGVNRRLRDTVLPFVIDQLFDGVSVALRGTVLPLILGQRAMQSNDAAEGSVLHNSSCEEVLLQVYFDVLYITGLFSATDTVEALPPPILAILRAIESAIDPITWSLVSPLLHQANRQLLSASALSFGSWNPKVVDGVWSVEKGTSNHRDLSKKESTKCHAITVPQEKTRFPLLPLIFGTSRALPGEVAVGNVSKFALQNSLSSGVTASTYSVGTASVKTLPPQESVPGAIGSAGKVSLAYGPSGASDGQSKGWMGSLWQ